MTNHIATLQYQNIIMYSMYAMQPKQEKTQESLFWAHRGVFCRLHLTQSESLRQPADGRAERLPRGWAAHSKSETQETARVSHKGCSPGCHPAVTPC